MLAAGNTEAIASVVVSTFTVIAVRQLRAASDASSASSELRAARLVAFGAEIARLQEENERFRAALGLIAESAVREALEGPKP
jgi:hypothetical protein